MRSTITARHTEITPELRERVHRLLPRLAKHARRPTAVEVIFDDDHGQKVVEMHLFAPRKAAAIARGEADDFVTALDRASEKLKHQLDGKAKRATDKKRVLRKSKAVKPRA
jgi:ribosomal subunit interface protein